MSSIEDLENMIDQLLRIAKQLNEASLHLASKETLGPIQKKQQELLRQLDCAYQEYRKLAEMDPENEAIERVSKKLKEFQLLNESFIKNIASSHEMINFDNDQGS